MTQDLQGPKTIVLIHGFWVTSRSWEHWITHYEAKGYKVVAPAYPGFEVEVEALNADPTPIVNLKVEEVVAKLKDVVAELGEQPILIGHSAGGAFTQLLLDQGVGAAGVAICSAPTEGVLTHPISQLKATFPVFKNPANRKRAVSYTEKEWRNAFANTFSAEESKALYERYHIPASGPILWGFTLAEFKPGRHSTYVDYKNEARPPLLFISGSEDHLMPAAVQRSNAKKYNKNVVTEVKVYEGMPHLMSAHKGWEEVADYALDWAVKHAKPAA